MIGSILRLLLNRKGILEIPGLGTFKSEYAASNIQFANRTILPTTFHIEFNSKPTSYQTSDLHQYLTAELGVSDFKSEKYIENFVSGVKKSLQTDRKCEIKGFGWLLLNLEGSVYFQMYEDFPYNLEAYGLKKLKAETVYSKSKVTSEREAPVIPLHPFDDEILPAYERESKSKPVFKWASVAAIFIATIISIGSVYMLSRQNFSSDTTNIYSGPVTQEATLVPVGKSAEEIIAKDPIEFVEPVRENKTFSQIAKPISKEEIVSETKVFYVVAGSFKDETRSGKLNKSLIDKGFSSVVLAKNEFGFVRVSIGRFSDKAEAISFLTTSQKDFEEHLWVLSGE